MALGSQTALLSPPRVAPVVGAQVTGRERLTAGSFEMSSLSSFIICTWSRGGNGGMFVQGPDRN